MVEELHKGLKKSEQQCKELTDQLQETDKSGQLRDLLNKCTDCKSDLEKTIKMITTNNDVSYPQA